MLGYPEAVGRFGRPPEARWAGEEDTLLGHGMYWWSEATSRHLASLFGVPPPHFLRTWPQVPVESLQAWETPVSRHDF
jgi:hypothetical protein